VLTKQHLVLLFLGLFCFTGPTLGQTDVFLKGIEAYQAKNYEAAKENFVKALELQPEAAEVLLNLGLTYHALGDAPRSLAYLRKAKSRDPNSAAAHEALKFLRSKGIGSEPLHSGLLAEAAEVLQRIPAVLFLILNPIFFILAGWGLLSYLARKRKASDADTVVFPRSLVLLMSAWGVGMSAQGLRTYYSLETLATVIAPQAQVLAAPKPGAPSLFEIGGGTEVLVLESKNEADKEWLQIQNRSDEVGWTPAEGLIVTSF